MCHDDGAFLFPEEEEEEDDDDEEEKEEEEAAAGPAPSMLVCTDLTADFTGDVIEDAEKSRS